MWWSLEIFGAWLSWCALNHNYTLPGSHQLVIDWLTPASSQYLVLMLCKGQKVQPFLPLPRWFLPFQMAPVVTLKSRWVTRWHDYRAERFHPLILPSRFFFKGLYWTHDRYMSHNLDMEKKTIKTITVLVQVSVLRKGGVAIWCASIPVRWSGFEMEIIIKIAVRSVWCMPYQNMLQRNFLMSHWHLIFYLFFFTSGAANELHRGAYCAPPLDSWIRKPDSC